VASGEKGEKDKPVTTQFINLDQICFGTYFNPTSGKPRKSTLEIAFSNGDTHKLSGEAAHDLLDFITRDMIELPEK
jgi:hypothetical protein